MQVKKNKIDELLRIGKFTFPSLKIYKSVKNTRKKGKREEWKYLIPDSVGRKRYNYFDLCNHLYIEKLYRIPEKLCIKIYHTSITSLYFTFNGMKIRISNHKYMRNKPLDISIINDWRFDEKEIYSLLMKHYLQNIRKTMI